MKKIVLFAVLFVAMMPLLCFAQAVKVGVEVLRDSNFKVLEGKRVGLVTNPTGIDRDFNSTVDILFNASNVKLVALFGPEHGVRGNAYAGGSVEDTVDPVTGLKEYSLFGKTVKPTPEMLKDIDVLVYDIQDNGCRSYTFISTLAMLIEACDEQNKELVVLDRPNPLGGNRIEGSLVEDGCYSFVSQVSVPYLYGLTVGELANLVNEEGLVRGSKGDQKPFKCKLTVVPMEGWHRNMLFAQTGQPWVLPSPHVPSAESALYYPISGIVGEFGFLSIGVGYTMPFQMFGAPWIKSAEFAKALNDLNLPGIKFRALDYNPFYAVYKGENVGGVQVYITDYDAAQLTPVNFYVMETVAKLYPDYKFFEKADKGRFRMFDIVCGSKYIRETFTKYNTFESIREYWNKDVESFRKLSSKYYMYR